IRHDTSALLLVDEKSRRYRVHMLQFAGEQSFIEEGDADVENAAKCPAGGAIATRRPALFDETALQALCPDSPVARVLIGDGLTSSWPLPPLPRDRPMGAINIARRTADMFGADDVDLLGEVAKQIAIAVDNAQIYREISELKDRLAKENLYLEEQVRN